jgi:hypothetical protein
VPKAKIQIPTQTRATGSNNIWWDRWDKGYMTNGRPQDGYAANWKD